MSELPPPVHEGRFRELEGATKEQVRKRAEHFVHELHSFLNRRSCLRDIQHIRRKWKPSVRKSRAFKDFATATERWYTFNAGGRNEPQFNVGLSTERLRIGLGFEFTKKMYGDPVAVQTAFCHFAGVLEQYRTGFTKFVKQNSLQVEWRARSERSREYVPTDEVLEWLLNPPEPFPEWIFVGRVLYRGRDAAILEDPFQLRRVIESVFKGFKHPWEVTQMKAQR